MGRDGVQERILGRKSKPAEVHGVLDFGDQSNHAAICCLARRWRRGCSIKHLSGDEALPECTLQRSGDYAGVVYEKTVSPVIAILCHDLLCNVSKLRGSAGIVSGMTALVHMILL